MKKILFLVFFIVVVSFGFFVFSVDNVFAYQMGIDITGLGKRRASEKALSEVIKNKEKIDITLTYQDKIFKLTKEDFEIGNVKKVVETAIKDLHKKKFISIFDIFSPPKNVVPFAKFLGGFEDIFDKIKLEIETEVREPKVTFNPNKKQMFTCDNGVVGVLVDENELYNRIENALENSFSANISVPVILTLPTSNKDEILQNIKKRSSFSTNYSSSVGGRRYNVLLSLSAFNGLVIGPNETISFNEVIRNKIPFSNFKVAKIIVNGEFVDGRGGGMCQASTTLYNALLLADLEVVKAQSHSLPVGYVKLAFDAMVNPPNLDLVFKNNLDMPIYIKTYGNDEDCFVEIYGQALPKGLTIKRKSEFVRSIKHEGDKIIADKEKKFEDKILYKGEFYRVKYPVEGIEANSYLQYFLDGELVEERFLRHSRYNSQQGIVYEGTENPLSQPNDKEIQQTSTYIAPQEKPTTTEENVAEKIKSFNPSHFNQ